MTSLVSAFFKSQGIHLPFGFVAGNGKKIPLPPRIPVYVSRMEFAAISDALADAAAAQGLGAVSAAAHVKVKRPALLRRGELRYLATADLDSKAGLIHITSTGHAHLKNKSSRGSVPLDEKLIQELEALRRRQNSLDSSPRKLLFADDQRRDGYSSLDDITDRATASVVALTGCNSFRPHDLRAAGATDTVLEVEAILQRLCAGDLVQQPDQTASSVTKRCARFALASRLARHASSLTTLRYYYCGGYLDLREQLDQATASEAPSGLFVADLLSLQPQTLYAKAHRLNGDSKIGSDWKYFPVLHSFFLHATASLPTPWLGEPQQTIQIEPLVALPTGEKMSAVHGALASFVGLSRRAAADRFDADERAIDRIAVATAGQAANLGITLNWADERAPLIGRAIAHTEKGAGQVMLRLATHMVEHPQWLLVHRPALLTCFHPDGTCLVARTMSQFQSLLPVLRQLQAAGLLPIVRFGTRAAPDEVSHFIRNGLLAGLARHPTNSQKDWSVSIQFVLCDSSDAGSLAPQPAPRTSARTLGRVGRLAVAALLLSLGLLDLIPLEKTHV